MIIWDEIDGVAHLVEMDKVAGKNVRCCTGEVQTVRSLMHDGPDYCRACLDRSYIDGKAAGEKEKP